jgi:hypothetical protein
VANRSSQRGRRRLPLEIASIFSWRIVYTRPVVDAIQRSRISASNMVENTLREVIVDRVLVVGQKLRQLQLAATLGVG